MFNDIYAVVSTVKDLPSTSSTSKSSKQVPSKTIRKSASTSKLLSFLLLMTCLLLISIPSTSALRVHTKSFTTRSHLVEIDEAVLSDKIISKGERASTKIVQRHLSINDEEERIRNGNHDLHIRGRRIKAQKPHWGKALDGVKRNDGIIWSDHLIVRANNANEKENFPTAEPFNPDSTSTSTSTTPTSTISSIENFPTANLKVEAASTSTSTSGETVTSSPAFPTAQPIAARDDEYTPLAVSTVKRTSKRPSPTQAVNKSPDDLLEEILSHFDLGADGGNMKLSWH